MTFRISTKRNTYRSKVQKLRTSQTSNPRSNRRIREQVMRTYRICGGVVNPNPCRLYQISRYNRRRTLNPIIPQKLLTRGHIRRVDILIEPQNQRFAAQHNHLDKIQGRFRRQQSSRRERVRKADHPHGRYGLGRTTYDPQQPGTEPPSSRA